MKCAMILPRHHKGLNIEKWFSLQRHHQILMIAAELNRAKHWIEKKDFRNVDLCYERAFELLDITVGDPKWKRRTRELMRFREMLAEQYARPQKDGAMNFLLYKTLIALVPGSCNALSSAAAS